MSEKTTQNYKNHPRFVPMYHFVAGLLVIVNLVWAIYKVIADFSWDRMIYALLAVTIFILGFYMRTFALAVQDRVIRLEERLRFARLFPDDLQSSVNDFTIDQYIGLRFASDEELPDLARKVKEENIINREDIKKLVKNWRADYQRV